MVFNFRVILFTPICVLHLIILVTRQNERSCICKRSLTISFYLLLFEYHYDLLKDSVTGMESRKLLLCKQLVACILSIDSMSFMWS